jgi:enoyl-CoA hydratase
MTGDLLLRVDGCAGRITLNRPQALNALTHEMCLGIEAALDGWAQDDAVRVVVIDGAAGRAFCSGGDIAELYRTGSAGDFDYGSRFWRDEYRLDAKLARYDKPIVSFLHGFTMGGGVGIGCHARRRIVGETSRIAMPECGIGLVPDVGGSLLLARAPGRVGEYMGLTGAQMGPADAIFAGFADHFIPEEAWPTLLAELVDGRDFAVLEDAAREPPEGRLAGTQAEIDVLFAGEGAAEVVEALDAAGTELAREAHTAILRNAPLSVSCAFDLIQCVRRVDTIEAALEQEYRFTSRAMEHGDFLEGIRAMIVDKDRTPQWRHARIGDVPAREMERMRAPVAEAEVKLEDAR